MTKSAFVNRFAMQGAALLFDRLALWVEERIASTFCVGWCCGCGHKCHGRDCCECGGQKTTARQGLSILFHDGLRFVCTETKMGAGSDPLKSRL
jgi:hypothetical protein